MKNKLFFCIIVCLCFVGVFSMPKLSKGGSLMMGNIEALSQTESPVLPEQGKRKIIVDNTECDILVGGICIGKGVFTTCGNGSSYCYEACIGKD